MEQAPLLPSAVTGAVNWRPEGIVYKKNEVFLDVIESINMVIAANGSVVHSEIMGRVQMKCNLSGMPELKLGLNDKVLFEQQGRSACLFRSVFLSLDGLMA
jgi:AP-1 complex subunit mu